jgi:hypothetical protein
MNVQVCLLAPNLGLGGLEIKILWNIVSSKSDSES